MNNVDTYKIIDLATLLVSKGRVDDTLKLIDKMGQCKDRNVSHFSVNIEQLLNAISEYGAKYATEENITRKILEKLKDRGYCEYTNTLLGNVIKEFFNKENIHDAVASFEQYAKQYRKTPQSFNLLTLLIELWNYAKTSEYFIDKQETVEYIQKVVNLMKEIGTENANLSVILAFALAGYEQQLRKILLNTTVRFNPQALLNNLSY